MMQYDYLMPDADNVLRERCNGAAHMIYGSILPEAVKERLSVELNAIETGRFATRYLIAAEISDQAKYLGYPTTTRGMLGSSFTSWLCGISSVNPLPTHYLCVNCRHFELAGDYADYCIHGIDLPKKNCPLCGAKMHSDGAAIPPEILMGNSFNREPEIILNCAPKIRRHIAEHLMKHLNASIIRSGVSRRGTDGKLTEGVHPGGMYIVSKDVDISIITPIRGDDFDDGLQLPITVRDYAELQNVLVRYDLLPLPALELLGDLERSTGIKTTDNCLNDNALLETLSRYGLNLMSSNQEEQEMAKTVVALAKPMCFSDIVKLYGLLYGKGTWDNNAESLLQRGVPLCDVIAYRDDILQYLEHKGVDRETSFRIMNRIKGGKGLTETDEQCLNKLGIPAWFIESCKKIEYLFPRSHGVEYAILNWKLAYYKLNYPNVFDELSSRL